MISPGTHANASPWSLASTTPGATLAAQGFVFLTATALRTLAGLDTATTERWAHTWNDLPPDRYLRDGGRYRSRRHSCFVQDVDGTDASESGRDGSGRDGPGRDGPGRDGPGRDRPDHADPGRVGPGSGLVQVAHRPHWQSTDYNALHGGIDRLFEPMAAELVDDPAWSRLLVSLGRIFAADSRAGQPEAGQPGASHAGVGHRGADHPGPGRPGVRPWSIEAHQFRIDTRDGMGRPTPEGAHRDGVDYVAVILVAREGIKGGETRIFEADGPRGMRFVMTQPWSAVLLNDRRMIHEATPIQPAPPGDPAASHDSLASGAATPSGHRDTLVLTYRADGFQRPGA